MYNWNVKTIIVIPTEINSGIEFHLIDIYEDVTYVALKLKNEV